jgi:HrpA-like RNA helicase
MIKECMKRLVMSNIGKHLHVVPLYGRLGKDEQDLVFVKAPHGKIKVIISTNIAETSITIEGITTVIDSGLVKLNHYNSKTFTSSLIEGPISQASANQRKGRAGRTQNGNCYRLYHRDDFKMRPLFTTEEIYRTDLSETVLRMADLGINEFANFDYISPPKRDGILGAIETLKLLDALNPDQTLSNVGKMMTEFPLPPRQSRIIVEAILHCPNVIQETIIAAAFLSTQNPQILPPGEEMEARHAHHRFRDKAGDFISYLNLYKAFKESKNVRQFCEKNYLDEKTMVEIGNVVLQLELIVSSLGAPILSGGDIKDYLFAIAKGMIQFVCVKEGHNMYRSLTADRIIIHPGSVMFKMDPQFIVAGEIVKTTRTYAMSVSPLTKETIQKISPDIFYSFFLNKSGNKDRVKEKSHEYKDTISIAGESFDVVYFRKKNMVMLPWEKLRSIKEYISRETINMLKNMRGCITFKNKYKLFEGQKLSMIFSLINDLDIDHAFTRNRPKIIDFNSKTDLDLLPKLLPTLLFPAVCKKSKKLEFVCLSTDYEYNYRFICNKSFHDALSISIASLEILVDELGNHVDEELKHLINQNYRRLHSYTKLNV